MNKNLLIGIVVIVILVAGGWYFFNNQSTQPENAVVDETMMTDDAITQTPSDAGMMESTGSSAAEGAVKEFTVTGSNFKFDIPEIRVKEGDTVKITFKNAGGFHDFVIDEFNVKTKQTNGPSEEVVTFVADKAGNYEFYCSVGQHRANGMEGKFIVE